MPFLRPNQPTWDTSLPVGCYHLHPPQPFTITLPDSRYSFYHPTKGRRLSLPKVCYTCPRLYAVVVFVTNDTEYCARFQLQDTLLDNCNEPTEQPKTINTGKRMAIFQITQIPQVYTLTAKTYYTWSLAIMHASSTISLEWNDKSATTLSEDTDHMQPARSTYAACELSCICSINMYHSEHSRI